MGKKAKEKGTRKVGEAGERKKEGGPVIISFTTLDWSCYCWSCSVIATSLSGKTIVNGGDWL